jgi:hypothetical protein
VDSDRFEKRLHELEYVPYAYTEGDVQMARRFGTTQSTTSRINRGQCRR